MDADLDRFLHRGVGRLRAWGAVKATVVVLLSLGIVGTVVAGLAQYLPALSAIRPALGVAIAAAGALTGVLAAMYLFCNRVLGQLEVDILALMATAEKQRT